MHWLGSKLQALRLFACVPNNAPIVRQERFCLSYEIDSHSECICRVGDHGGCRYALSVETDSRGTFLFILRALYRFWNALKVSVYRPCKYITACNLTYRSDCMILAIASSMFSIGRLPIVCVGIPFTGTKRTIGILLTPKIPANSFSLSTSTL